jgi:ATP-dependent Lon protease
MIGPCDSFLKHSWPSSDLSMFSFPVPYQIIQDGPSAGIAMVTSMLSLALQRPIRNDLAMTGEVSLTGKVLPVGGIKEKIMGGRRSGIKSIILPSANQRDFDEIPDYLKEGLEVHFAEDYETVYGVALGR